MHYKENILCPHFIIVYFQILKKLISTPLISKILFQKYTFVIHTQFHTQNTLEIKHNN